MKKLYTKPNIMFEDFSLSTSIAGNCEGIVGNPSKGSCAVLGSGNIRLFDSSVGVACQFSPEQLGGAAGMYNGMCYHVPSDSSNLFNS